MAAAYEWHNYGKSTIGNRSDIERVPIDNLQAFYKKYYQPDNVMLIVAGKFDEAKALRLHRQVLRRSQEAGAQARQHLHRGAGPGRRTHRRAAPRRQGRRGRRGLPHSRRRASTDFAAVEVLTKILARTSRPAGSTRLWSRPRRPAACHGSAYGRARPGRRSSSPPRWIANAIRSTPCATRSSTCWKTLAKEKVDGRGSRPRQAASSLKDRELLMTDSQPHRHRAERVGGQGRLAAVLPAPRPRRPR